MGLLVTSPGVTLASLTTLLNGTYAPIVALWLPGSSASYLSTPDSAALSIIGDLDLRAKVALTDWTPVADVAVIGKWAAVAHRSYLMEIQTNGRPILYWTTDGTTVSSASATAAPVIADGALLWVRVTLDVDNGAAGNTVTFYTSTDGTTWTQLGAAVTTGGTTSIFDSDAVASIGASGTPSDPLTGLVYRGQIYSGIAGTLVADFRGDAPTGPRYRDSLGNIWTFNGSGWAWQEI